MMKNKKILAILILTLLATTYTTNTMATQQQAKIIKYWTEKRLEEKIDCLKIENTVLAKELARIPTDWDYTEFKAEYLIQPHIEDAELCPQCKKYFPEERCEEWIPKQTQTNAKQEKLLREKTKLEKEQEILREALIYHAERHYRNRTYKKRFSKCEKVVLHFKTPGSDIECCPQRAARYMVTIIATRPKAEQPRSWLCPNIETPPPKQLCEATISIRGEYSN